MQLIVVSTGRGRIGQLSLGSRRLWLGACMLACGVCGLAFWGGFRVASAFGITNPEAQVAEWRAELAAQESVVESAQRAVQQQVDALALRLGEMNAHVVRLDALGSRLTQMAGLDNGEFDFTTPPSLGGPEEGLSAEPPRITGVMSAL
jgi:hypothetical protein